MKIIVIRYAEIALKGKNRNWFEKVLISNIKKHFQNLSGFRVKKIHGRIYIEIQGDPDLFLERLRFIPGIANFSLAILSNHDPEAMGKIAVELVDEYFQKFELPPRTFKIEASRSDKRFPMNSMELSAQLGGNVLDKYPDLIVKMKGYDFSVGVEIWPKEQSILFLEKISGQGGLPVGVSGSVLSFLSGGIDSPVSSWMMMKRGCQATLLYFHSYPFVGEQSRQKSIDLAKQLSRFQPNTTLLIASLTEIQKSIKEHCGESIRTVLYRRMMYRVAEKIKKQWRANAYVTGEALGQVASQTMANIHCTENATSIPVFRPLIGMDKSEIIEISKKIGTYPISIQPFPDCCTVFQPKKPETYGTLEQVFQEEEKLPNIEELIENSADSIEKITIQSEIQDQFWED